ncbi:MAG TPA: hypothetical protein VFH60_13230, partial [Chloroflexia bacterium]|nr:hypothetical protein [Chloroflexia bacterium]
MARGPSTARPGSQPQRAVDPDALATEAAAAIREILQAQGDNIVGLNITELTLHLRTKGVEAQPRFVDGVVRRMRAQDELAQHDDPRRRGGVCYHLPGMGPVQTSLFDMVATRDEIERQERTESDLWAEDETAREQYTASVMHQIASGHATEERMAELVRDVASVLATENPVALIMEIVRWVVADLNGLAERMRAAPQGRTEEVRGLARELGFRRMKAVRFLQRLWRLDASAEGIPGILDLPTIPKMMDGYQVWANLERVEQQLRKRVIGEHVIEIVSLPENTLQAAVGTDASVGDVMIEHARGSFMPPTPAVLFVAAGALRVRGEAGTAADGEGAGAGAGARYWDYDIDPRELEQYEDLAAAEEGLMISPRLRRDAISDFRHLRSAAMELRQYVEELRIVQRRSHWYPMGEVVELHHPPEIPLLVRDGRIYPLVHRLDDYDGASAPDDVLYGEVVRREIRTFREVFHSTAGLGRMGAIYGGAVKSPEFSWLAMLTFWYLHARQGHADLADTFYRPPLSDQAVTHLLFWGLARANRGAALADPRGMFVTFRAVRRYSDIAFPAHPLVIVEERNRVLKIVDEDSEDDWFTFIGQHIDDANESYNLHKRGVPALPGVDEYRPFLDLCRRAGVAMFYAAPARMYRATVEDGSHFLMPRWEVAVDLTGTAAATLQHQLER